MKKIYYIILFLICTSVTLEATVIYLSNQSAGNSLGVAEAKSQIAQLTEENRHLRQEVLKYSSLKNIASKAAEIGFAEGNEFISLDTNYTIASR